MILTGAMLVTAAAKAALASTAVKAALGAGVGAYSAYAASNAGSDYQSGALAQQTFSAEQAAMNRAFQERMSRNRHTYEVEDLKRAGLNPILSATRGASVPAGNVGAAQNIQAHRPTLAIQKQQLLANIASTAQDINLKSQMAKTEGSKQALNYASAIKAGGYYGVPGFYQQPIHSAKQGWLERAQNIIKGPKPIQGPRKKKRW